MNLQLTKFVGLFVLAGICMAIIAAFPNSEDRGAYVNQIPALQQPPTPTPRPNCPVPTYPAAAYGRQPYPTEIAPYFNQAGLNQLGNAGPPLPTMIPAMNSSSYPYVPCTILKAIGYTENGWKHFNTDYNGYGYTEIGSSCDYGLMQIVSGMSGGGGFEADRTNEEIPYNIGTGTRMLIKKWNALKLESGGFEGGAYIVGEGNSRVVEDWYYAVWAYNTWGNSSKGWKNNPNNNCPGEWDPTCGGWKADRLPFDGSQDKRWYPYQELVWGYAAHPPTYNGVPLWQAVDLTLPKRTDVGGAKFIPPNKTLPRPEPHHGSCSANYLPIIIKNPSSPPPTPDCRNYLKNEQFDNDLADWDFQSRPFLSFIPSTCTDNDPPVIVGDYKAARLGRCDNNIDTLYQSVTIPAQATDVYLQYQWYIITDETDPPGDNLEDYMDVMVSNGSGVTQEILEGIYSSDHKSSWEYSTYSLNDYRGQTIRVVFEAVNEAALSVDDPTNFYIDTTAVVVCGPSSIHP